MDLRSPSEPPGVTVTAITPTFDGPLQHEYLKQLTLANGRAKTIRKAASVAAFNGWVTGFFAVCSAPFAIFSVAGFLVAAGLSLVTYNEFQGRKRLLHFDPASSTLLGWNQIGLLGLIVVYCLWMMFSGLTSAGPFAAEMAAKPELREALGSLDEFDGLYRVLVVAVYGTVIVFSAIFQGLNAFYYFSRGRHVTDYVQQTPGWVLDVQRITRG